MRHKTGLLIIALLLLGLLLSGCAGSGDTPADNAGRQDSGAAEAFDEDAVSLPEGAEELNAGELEQIKRWIDADFIRGRFLQSTYTDPEDIDLYSLFFYGYGSDREATEIGTEDMQAFLGQYGWWGHFETTCVTEEGMDEVLKEYADTSFSETNQIHLDGLYHVDDTDRYYSFHGDIIDTEFEPVFGYADGDMLYLYYHNSINVQHRMTGTYRITLRKTDDGYLFLANEFCDESESPLQYVVELYEPTEATGYFSTDETVEQYDMVPDPELSSQSMEEALNAIRGQEGFREEGVPELILENIAEYGTAIAGMVDGEQRLYYISTEGTVYSLPLFVDDVDFDDVVFNGGGYTFEYMIEEVSEPQADDETAEASLSVTDYCGTLLLPAEELYVRVLQSVYEG